jgi:23S rRNA pseudouridine2605 synthase
MDKKGNTPPPPASGDDRQGERIARRMARAGVASRRDAETMIADGRVSVNGRVVESPALNVTADDRVAIDGQLLAAADRTRLWLFHKPRGTVTSNRDPEGRQTVFDVLPQDLPRVITIGRLDINTEGLLLLTNDGGLARVLELPSTGWQRRYRVRVHGEPDPAALAKLAEGIVVEGVVYGPIEASVDRAQGSNAWLSISLREGKNREVKNVLGALGLEVTRLIRVSFGPFVLGDIAEGDVVEIKGRVLRDQLGEKLVAQSGADFETPLPATTVEDIKPAKPAKPEGPAPRNKRNSELVTLERPVRKQGGRDTPFERKAGPGKAGARRDGDGKDGSRKPASGKETDASRKPFTPPRNRGAHVWMAKGARPLGPKGEAEAAERAIERAKKEAKFQRNETRRSARDEASGVGVASAPRKRFGEKRDAAPGGAASRDGARPAGRKSFGFKSHGSGGPRDDASGNASADGRGGRSAGYKSHAGGAAGGRQRDRGPAPESAGGAAATEGGKSFRKGPPRARDGAGAPGAKPFRPRPQGDRPSGGRPSGGGSADDRPRSDRPRSDSPRSDRPRHDGPRHDGPRNDRPRFEKRAEGDGSSAGASPRPPRAEGGRPFQKGPPRARTADSGAGERPRGDRKPGGDRPRNDRSGKGGFGESAGRPQSRSPDGRPAEGRPEGRKPFGKGPFGKGPGGSGAGGKAPGRSPGGPRKPRQP